MCWRVYAFNELFLSTCPQPVISPMQIYYSRHTATRHFCANFAIPRSKIETGQLDYQLLSGFRLGTYYPPPRLEHDPSLTSPGRTDHHNKHSPLRRVFTNSQGQCYPPFSPSFSLYACSFPPVHGRAVWYLSSLCFSAHEGPCPRLSVCCR